MNLIDIAHEYKGEGLNPLPLKSTKAPNLPSGHKFLYEEISDDEIDKYFGSNSTQKIGIACGAVSDGLYCLDFDCHKNEPIDTIFKSFVEVFYIKNLISEGKLSIYKTPSGGYHAYFKDDAQHTGTAFALWENKGVMIEIRANGQYCAVYPSEGYSHFMGLEFVKLQKLDDGEVSLIFDLARSFNKYENLIDKTKKVSIGKWGESWKENTPQGKYNLEFGDEAKELLSQYGWQYCFTNKENVDYWTRPNKDPKDGFSATFGHQKNMFYIFSADANCKPFDAGQGYNPFQILTLLKYDGDWVRAKEDLKKRFNMVDSDIFWSVSQRGNFELNNKMFRDFLEGNDFFKNTPNNKSTFNFIKKDGIFVNIVYEKDIKDFVLEWIEENKISDGVFNLVTGELKFFKRDFLSMIKSKEITTLKDNKENCFLYYKNCIVKIDKKGKEVLNYQDLGVNVWKDQVVDRDFIESDHHKSEYRTFIWKISGQDKDKYKAFQSVIGYLLHTYKSNSNNRAIIFNDEIISDTPNGRSGKGLFWNALKQLRKVQSLDGKTFDFEKSFPYQNVSTDCQVLVFDDVKKGFKFESLFSVITEGITIEYKGKDSIKLDVTESPKIIITTNYTIQGDSSSFNARKYEVEMSSYFNENYTPLDEFGHELFNDWDEAEWARFDNYMQECVKIYIQQGLIPMPLKNLGYRKLIDKISFEIYQFCESIQNGEWIKIKALFDEFIKQYPEKSREITQNKLTSSIKEYAKYNNIAFNTAYSGGVGKIILGENKIEEDECPF